MDMTDTRSAADISRAASEKFIEENTAITSSAIFPITYPLSGVPQYGADTECNLYRRLYVFYQGRRPREIIGPWQREMSFSLAALLACDPIAHSEYVRGLGETFG
jgi:hypothetical protein